MKINLPAEVGVALRPGRRGPLAPGGLRSGPRHGAWRRNWRYLPRAKIKAKSDERPILSEGLRWPY